MPPRPVSGLLRSKLRTSCILGKHATTRALPPAPRTYKYFQVREYHCRESRDKQGRGSMSSRLSWKSPLGRGQRYQGLLCARAAGSLGDIQTPALQLPKPLLSSDLSSDWCLNDLFQASELPGPPFAGFEMGLPRTATALRGDLFHYTLSQHSPAPDAQPW